MLILIVSCEQFEQVNDLGIFNNSSTENENHSKEYENMSYPEEYGGSPYDCIHGADSEYHNFPYPITDYIGREQYS